MARKYDFISELYNRTCKMVVANPESWEAFLRSACYNYRLRFDEQLLVHAQRPDATAVLQIDDWNQKFGRWVNRGAHGIAVFEDADQRRQRLVHYFDISDTHPSRFSRRVPIWQMRDEYTAEVIDTLESTFGELDDKETLAVAIESAARNAVEDNIPDYLSDLIYSVKDSFLDGVSEEEITHIFKTAVRNSVAYMTMTRLGIEAGEYFEPDDLRDVVNFTTPATLNALGYATSDIAEMGLAEISRTILALDRQNRIIAEKTKADYNVGKEKTERSPDDERDHLHEAGGLSAPRSDNAGAARAVDGQVRPDAEEVPEGASQGTLLQPADELRPERASERHGAQSERDGTDADGADGSVGGRDGESESDGYDELGSEDEQYPEPGSGDRDGGGNLRLDYYDRSHEDKSLPFFGGDDTVREILGTTPHLKASKDEIRAFFEATADENARISYIKRIFNNDYTEVILSDGRRVGYKTYQNVLQLWEGSYLSRTAQSFYDWGVIAQHFEAMRLLGELQDTMKPQPSIDGQLSLMTAGAEERKPSAFTFSQEIIDAVLTRGSGISEGKMRIYEQFQKSLSADATVTLVGEAVATGTDANTYPMGLKPSDFTATSPNYKKITIEVTDGWLKIDPIADKVTVTVTENSAAVTYDGTEHSVTGYKSMTADNTLYDVEKNVAEKPTKAWTAKGTDAGEYPVGIVSGDFRNTSKNFTNVEFVIVDGTLKIDPVSDKVTVTITENADTVIYDTKEHSVTGYKSMTADNALYDVKKNVAETPTEAWTAKGTDVGEYPVGIKAGDFENTSSNFTNVEFVIVDGALKIAPAESIVVKIAGNTKTVTYNGEEQSVEGYTVTSNPANAEVTLVGKAVAAGTDGRLLTAIWPMVATAPLVEDEQWEPMTRLSRAYQRASCGGSCSNTSRPAP